MASVPLCLSHCLSFCSLVCWSVVQVKPGEKMSQALKVVGEDITEGKITAPVAKAMSLLKTKAERQEIWDIVKSKPHDQKVCLSLPSGRGVAAALSGLAGRMLSCVVCAMCPAACTYPAVDFALPASVRRRSSTTASQNSRPLVRLKRASSNRVRWSMLRGTRWTRSCRTPSTRYTFTRLSTQPHSTTARIHTRKRADDDWLLAGCIAGVFLVSAPPPLLAVRGVTAMLRCY
jgi:hypothetical protein